MMGWFGGAVCVALVGVCLGLPTSPLTSEDSCDADHQPQFLQGEQLLLNTDAVTFENTRVQEATLQQLRTIAGTPARNTVVIDLDAGWCDSSQRFRKVFAQMADRLVMREDVVLMHVDVDSDPELRKVLGVTQYPSVVLWPKGKSLYTSAFKFTGKRSRANLMSWIEYHAPSGLYELAPATKLVEPSLLASTYVCDAKSGATNADLSEEDVDSVCDAVTRDHAANMHALLQKTQTAWSTKAQANVFAGPADNTVVHGVERGLTPVANITDAAFDSVVASGNYIGLYFYSSNCTFCSCLLPVWEGVNFNLVTSEKQGQLTLTKVNGVSNPKLMAKFNVTKYPTFILTNQQGNALGRYSGPRKVFDISTWIQDLIMADNNQIVNHVFSMDQNITYVDHNPIYPYEGADAFPKEMEARNWQAASSSPSITPTISPSPSVTPTPPCPPENDMLANLVAQESCANITTCSIRGTVGIVLLSACPTKCQSCTFASSRDNDRAVAGLFGSVCMIQGKETCTCRSLVDLCPPNTSGDTASALATLCPRTCNTFALMNNAANSAVAAKRTALLAKNVVSMGQCKPDQAPGFVSKFVYLLDAMHVLHGTTELAATQVSAGVVPTKPMFVDFYVPWCKHCSDFAPVWGEVSKSAESNLGAEFVVGTFDCTKFSAAAKDLGVSGYPTVVFFPANQPMQIRRENLYAGKRSQGEILAWMEEMLEAHPRLLSL